jgi:hypothetical protein
MVKIYQLDAYRPQPASHPPLTRNQELLAEIQARWAARTPEEIRLAEIRGTQEELEGVQRRYDRLTLTQAQSTRPWPSEGETIVKEESPKPERINWKGADLRGVNMAGVNMENADLRATDLKGANFTGTNLRYADFRGASVQGANFQNADLYGARMQGVEAAHADFRGADMRLVNLGGAYLDGAMLPPPAAMSSHKYPSEIAKANRQKAEQPAAKPKSNGKDNGQSM